MRPGQVARRTGLEDLAALLTAGGVSVLAFAGSIASFPAELRGALDRLGQGHAGAIVLLYAQTPGALSVLTGAFPVAATVLGQAGLQ